jgi:hypothetical protein
MALSAAKWWRDWCLARFRDRLQKNLCHGRPCFALGYYARICLKCKCRPGLFWQYHCGIRGKAVTSLNVELGVEKVNEDEVRKILNHLTELFACEIKEDREELMILQSLPSVVFLNELYISKNRIIIFHLEIDKIKFVLNES